MSLYSRFLQLRFLVCVLVFLHCSLALAQINSSDLQFRSKSVLIETRLSILVGKYVPPLFVQYTDKSNRTTVSPEKTAIAFFSAMADGDYAEWLALWSEESRAVMNDRNKSLNRSSAELAKNWEGIIRSRPVELLGRADYERGGFRFSLVNYRIRTQGLTITDQASGQTTSKQSGFFEGTIALKKNGVRWESVQDLARDPVFSNSALLFDDARTEVLIKRSAE